ncbi:MAG: multifunctional CCA addition/repair protein [Burkholderiaceae bacterium]|nr:multifunctional CCA addition/repair protein [Burkholderiaceae bacterium]
MQVYRVGGAVRDRLLGLPVNDHDWVVVGASTEQMLAAGYTAVGRDFPVFLHPQTGEEYALARTERKSAPGYRGFTLHADPGVTLEDDLARRDLTINAIAQAADGSLIDPFDGQRDLRAGVLRHVSNAFAEDPVRILRLARFAARWPHFSIAPETAALCAQMVAAGEADALVVERVWQELSRGLMEVQPSRMFAVLRDCGALVRLLPELDRLWGVPQPEKQHPEVDTGVHVMMVLDAAARLEASLPVRWACLVHDLGKGTTPRAEWPNHVAHELRGAQLADAVAERLRVPVDCSDMASLVVRQHGSIHKSQALDAAATLDLLERCDALRRPDRFEQALQACECDAHGRTGLEDAPYPQRERLSATLRAVLSADASGAATEALASGAQGPEIGEAVRRARLAALSGQPGHADPPAHQSR